MTYIADEISVEDGAPTEFYKFVGTVEDFRYTSSEEDITADMGDGEGSQTWAAVPIIRNEISVPPDGTSPELEVRIPIVFPAGAPDLAQKYVFQVGPPDLDLTVFRRQGGGNVEQYWFGPVTSFSVQEREITMTVPTPLGQLMGRKIPSVYYQPFCNNILFDPICSIASANFKESQFVATNGISGDGREVTVTALGLELRPNDWAKGGDLVMATTGERRMILSQTGLVLTILYPFSVNLIVGAAVDVFAGCNHAISTCKNKFDNVDNFTGMPYVLSQDLNPTQAGT